MPVSHWRRPSSNTSRPSAAAAERSRCCGGRARPYSIRTSPWARRIKMGRASSTSRSRPGTSKETVLAAEIPDVENGGPSPDGKTATWKLKPNAQWHDGQPFTAEDVVFNWEYASDPATAAVSIGSYKDMTVEKVDPLTVRIHFAKPTPFWANAFVGARGMLIP